MPTEGNSECVRTTSFAGDERQLSGSPASSDPSRCRASPLRSRRGMRDGAAGSAAPRSGPPADHALVIFLLVFDPEVSLENVLSDHAAQPVPLFDGMTEMHAAKDTCVVDLSDDILEAVK
jgi:hypothetical protein